MITVVSTSNMLRFTRFLTANPTNSNLGSKCHVGAFLPCTLPPGTTIVQGEFSLQLVQGNPSLAYWLLYVTNGTRTYLTRNAGRQDWTPADTNAVAWKGADRNITFQSQNRPGIIQTRGQKPIWRKVLTDPSVTQCWWGPHKCCTKMTNVYTSKKVSFKTVFSFYSKHNLKEL